MSKLVDKTFERALGVLRDNATKFGLRTSAAYYNQIWARDSFISFLGANPLRDERLMKLAKTTLETLGKTRSPLGQIANFYDLVTNSPEFGFSGSTDSSCWYIIGLASLFQASEDRELLKGPVDAALDAYRWLRYQDANNTWLVDSPQGADWMDAAVQRSGKTLYNNILFLMATKSVEKLLSVSGRAIEGALRLDWDELTERFDDVFLPDSSSPGRVAKYWPTMGRLVRDTKPMNLSQEYYLQYVSFARIDTRFDTLSNLLCILSGVASPKASASILKSIRSKGLAKPYPIRNLHPPYTAEGESFDTTFNATVAPQHRSIPYSYHNGAVWPFIGGVYASALYRTGAEYAAKELENLAKANAVHRKDEKTGFNEWLHGRTGKALGQYGQSWSAGMYIGAYLASKGENLLKPLNAG